MPKKIIVAVTGASGSIYAESLFRKLQTIEQQFEECSVIFSETGKKVWEYELPNINYSHIPYEIYDDNDLFSTVASGSAMYDTMIVCPCSMGTLGRIANGASNSLLTRAADVMLKERRKLILVTREMPLSLIHINNMKTVTEAGGIICPASPSFYSLPKNVDEMIVSVVDKTLELAGFEVDTYRWGH